MKRLSTPELRPGMVVAENVLSFDRQLVMAKGTVLTDNLITRLDLYGILTIFIDDSEPGILSDAEPVTPEDVLSRQDSEPTYAQKVRESKAFHQFKETYAKNVGSFKDAVNNVVERNLDVDMLLSNTLEMIQNAQEGPCVLDMLQTMRNYDDSTFTHCLNVGLICNVLAKWLKLTPDQVEMATACGLFHDIGKLKIPHDIITKPGKLSAHEYSMIQKHPILGYQLLQNQKVDDNVRNAALMHHERSDGSGYPMRLSGNQIDPYARIVAIADVYDAMTAARCYRGPLCPFRVIEIFEEEGFQKYDVGFLLVFLENVVNTYIRNSCLLSDGRKAEIVFINKDKLSRPMVRCGSKYINLADHPELSIVELL